MGRRSASFGGKGGALVGCKAGAFPDPKEEPAHNEQCLFGEMADTSLALDSLLNGIEMT